MPAASPVTIHNEQTKLWAAQLERMGTAAFSLGVLGPLAAATFSVEAFNKSAFPLILGIMTWIMVAIMFYTSSQQAMKGLRQ